jgi:hypothetical protein
MSGRFTRMTDSRDKRAREIQDAIGEVLMQHWDPIEVADVPEARGEYDSYVGPVYRVLAGSHSEEELISYLSHMETKMMGFERPPRASSRSCEPIART